MSSPHHLSAFAASDVSKWHQLWLPIEYHHIEDLELGQLEAGEVDEADEAADPELDAFGALVDGIPSVAALRKAFDSLSVLSKEDARLLLRHAINSGRLPLESDLLEMASMPISLASAAA